jgi:hypothetical protein
MVLPPRAGLNTSVRRKKAPSSKQKSPNLGKQVEYNGADANPIYGRKGRKSAGDGALKPPKGKK